MKSPSLGERIRRRFQFLRWPLAMLGESDELRRSDFPLRDRCKKTRYPTRALRYWWAACAILSEARRLGRPPIIVDVGCEHGTLKRFTPLIRGSKWIGLDWRIRERTLTKAQYDKVHTCNLDEGIPLPDGGADIVVCLHVLEHLACPEFTVREFVRVLRPGGILLLCTPVLPRGVAQIRERQLQRQFQSGTRKRGKHVNAFWPGRLRDLAEKLGLGVELMVASYLIRWTGWRLENFRLWVRLNQLLGALFPSMGGEICIQLRKPHVGMYVLEAAPSFARRHAVKLAFCTCLAAAILAVLIVPGFIGLIPKRGSTIARMIRLNRDENDEFYVVREPVLASLADKLDLRVLSNREIDRTISKDLKEGEDAHFLVAQSDMRALAKHRFCHELFIVGSTQYRSEKVFLLSTEEYGQPLERYGNGRT